MSESDAFAEASQMVIEMFPILVIPVLVVAAIITAYNVGRDRGKSAAIERRKKNKKILDRESDYVDVVYENEDGVGVAIQNGYDFIDIVSFDELDEIDSRVFFKPEHAAAIADALSEIAGEREVEMHVG